MSEANEHCSAGLGARWTEPPAAQLGKLVALKSPKPSSSLRSTTDFAIAFLDHLRSCAKMSRRFGSGEGHFKMNFASYLKARTGPNSVRHRRCLKYGLCM